MFNRRGLIVLRGGQGRKGFFLVFTLWLFLLLSLFCLGLGFRSFIAVKKTKFFLNRTRAHALAVSGIKKARKILEEDALGEESGKVDHLLEGWAKLGEEEGKINFSSPKKEARLIIAIEDEASRVKIEEDNENILKELFYRREIEGPQEKLGYIFDYMDADSIPRGGDFDSENEGDVKNQGLSAAEELLLVKNISSQDYANVEDLITIYDNGENKLNINTVKKELLDLLLDVLVGEGTIQEEAKEGVLNVRFGPNRIEGDEDDGYYGETGASLPSELEDVFKTTSDIFRVKSEAEIDGASEKITCVVDRESGKILYWNEK